MRRGVQSAPLRALQESAARPAPPHPTPPHPTPLQQRSPEGGWVPQATPAWRERRTAGRSPHPKPRRPLAGRGPPRQLT